MTTSSIWEVFRDFLELNEDFFYKISLILFFFILQETWDLKNSEEKYDAIPEIWNSHNVADFIDPEIEAKLNQLEEEEDRLIQGGFYDKEMEPMDEEAKDIKKLAKKFEFILFVGTLFYPNRIIRFYFLKMKTKSSIPTHDLFTFIPGKYVLFPKKIRVFCKLYILFSTILK